MDTVKIGQCDVSRFVLGTNPVSGFSHQGPERDREMVRYYTSARIKQTLREAESLGINAVIARADLHVVRVLMEYWDEGGRIQWIGQTCPGVGPPEMCLQRVADADAPACHIHGGYADGLLAKGQMDQLISDVAYARELGVAVGLAGHNPDTFRWAEQNLDLDYYMCSYYNPGAHRSEPGEPYGRPEDRQAMTELIRTLSKPVIHYKVMAAGRNDPGEALTYVARSMRPGDAVCVGIYTKDKPDMLTEDVELLESGLASRAAEAPAP